MSNPGDRRARLFAYAALLAMPQSKDDAWNFRSFSGEIGRARELRPCIVCGKPKDHNNAFCSAECCRQHKAQKQ